MDLNQMMNPQSKMMFSTIDELSLPLAYSSDNIKLSKNDKTGIIRYTWNKTDERIFYYKDKNDIDLNEAQHFPGLIDYLNKKGIGDVSCGTGNKTYLTLDSSRGTQSFAFGHFFVDIAPVLLYLYTQKKLNLPKNNGFLIYKDEIWQRDILNMIGIPSNSLEYLDNMRPVKIHEPICDYWLDICFIKGNLEKLRKNFATIPFEFKKLTCKQDILFLKREEIGNRPKRWINLDQCINKCRVQIKEDIKIGQNFKTFWGVYF